MDIVLDGVELRHPGMEKPLLRVPAREIPSGTAVVLRGASGSGKTTLLHVIAGLIPPAAGSITLAGRALATLGESARARLRRHEMGIVFQRLNVLEHLTALENVRLGRPGVRVADARAALDTMGLADLAGRRAEVLSLGEQQRVAMARVLAARPALLLADEPTSALDDTNTERVVAALRGEVERGCTVVVVTHDARIGDDFGALWRIEDGTVR
ncbi:MAG: ATP-binding cassette domain-containing protein [Deltaproteobacteria bacterium]|nr:MAG: ATP-binding cassette domain-containing protein [Deltaproteobacteria bacterium]